MLWNKQAEIAEKYLDKGSQIAIEGRLASRYYTDKDGARHQVTEIVVSEILIGSPPILVLRMLITDYRLYRKASVSC